MLPCGLLFSLDLTTFREAIYDESCILMESLTAILECIDLTSGEQDISNRHYPKIRNCYGNIHAAILNGATMLIII